MKTPQLPRRPAGFTLIELMIGMVMGLFIVIALITLLININRNNSELAKNNRLIENGRLAMQILSSDISHAGYLGGYLPDYDDLTTSGVPTQVPTAVPDPCTAYSAANWTSAYQVNVMAVHVAGYQVPTSGTAPVCSGVVTNAKSSSSAQNDVLVVRHIETCTSAGTLSECANTTANAHPDVHFQSSRCSTDATKFIFTNAAGSLTLHKGDCTAVSDIRRFASTLYYVRTFSTASGDNIPTLMRSKYVATSSADATQQSADALIEGVEGFVVEFGIDNLSRTGAAVDFTTAINWVSTSGTTAYKSSTNRGDGNPDTYIHCTTGTPCTAAQLMNAVSIRIYLLMRADTMTAGYTDSKTYTLGSVTMGPFNDNFKRHVFTQTVRLSNVAGRRELPN